MKIKNKKSIKLSLLVIVLLFADIVFATSMETDYSVTYESSSGQIRLVNLRYEPYPVNPGEYFNIWIKVQKSASFSVKEATFELVPEYPFSLDSNEDALRSYGELTTEPIVLKYKVRVNKDAVEGINELNLKYNTDGGKDSWMVASFDIEVSGAQTEFDAVVQEINGNEISIALANTGKKDANSVIVMVPEQEYFESRGTSGQMVGNLESGDYTLVVFDISEKKVESNERLKLKFEEKGGEESGNLKITAEKEKEEKFLELQVDYTDTIGERRSIIKKIPLESGSLTSSEEQTNAQFMMNRFEKKIYQKWWFWAIVIVILCVGWIAYKKQKRKKEKKEEQKIKRKQR